MKKVQKLQFETVGVDESCLVLELLMVWHLFQDSTTYEKSIRWYIPNIED